MLSLLDELIERHRLTGPFLDLGCGAGAATVHLARRGWTGMAVDLSESARSLTRDALRHFPGVEVCERSGPGPFNTILMLDVLEHLADDRGALAEVAARQPADGCLILTVPTNHAREWRWDDDLYGHLRRYDPDRFPALLAEFGYRVLEVWDFTFPIFWLMRRGFTAFKRAPALAGSASERTESSGTAEAWDLGVVSDLLSNAALWRPVFALQRRFRHRPKAGHEAMVLARRVAT